MCGIIGYKSFNGTILNKGQFIEALDKMNYRGPDGQEIVEKKGQLIGHVRLSIIDLKGGSQPMEIDDHLISFNGEIYNFKELRHSLCKEGVVFRTNSDTEVILAGYLKRGYSFFRNLVGMFAFAIHHPDGTILLHRDQTGQKPLYYYKDNNRLAYSTTLSSIVHLLGPQNLSFDAIILYLYLSYIPSPFCIFENIKKVNPGWVVRIDKHGVYNSWKINTNGNDKTSIDDIIKYSTVSDIPIALSLSAGIDSSLILKSIYDKLDIAYTVKNKGWNNNNNEWKYASRFTKSLNVKHSIIAVNELNIKTISRIHDKMDEPFGDSSILMADLVAAKAKRDGIKVVLTGDGADEFFTGYRKHRALFYFSYLFKTPKIFQKIILPFIPNGKMRKILKQSKNLDEAYMMTLNMGVENFVLKEIATKILSCEFNIKENSLMDCILNDRQIVLEGDMMVKSDRIYMQHGVESRPVFALNIMHEKVENLKINDLISFSKMKIPLKKHLTHLPDYITKRSKTGFESPLEKLPVDKLNAEIQLLLDKYLLLLNAEQKKIIVDVFKSVLKSSSIREKYVAFIFTLWLKINSKQIKWD
jgi:asparagine synthase (glutamine-hydrolysing)